MSETPKQERSLVWLIIPFFTGVIGGILTYQAFRRDDKKLAEKCLYIGLATTALASILIVLVFVSGQSGEVYYDDKYDKYDKYDKHDKFDNMFGMYDDKYDKHDKYDDGFDSLSTTAKDVTYATISLYDDRGTDAFKLINDNPIYYDEGNPSDGELYPFVVAVDDDLTIIAHGADSDRVGTSADVLLNEHESVEQLLQELEINDGAWVNYEYFNPANGLTQEKTSWLVLHDGYVFGSGYYH